MCFFIPFHINMPLIVQKFSLFFLVQVQKVKLVATRVRLQQFPAPYIMSQKQILYPAPNRTEPTFFIGS